MRSLNRENYNELMFELLENIIQGEEREALLNQIQADPFYREQWQHWMHTLVEDKFKLQDEQNLAFLDTLMIKPEKKRMVIGVRWMAAASILLICSIAFLVLRKSHVDPIEPVNNPLAFEKNLKPGRAGKTADSSEEIQLKKETAVSAEHQEEQKEKAKKPSLRRTSKNNNIPENMEEIPEKRIEPLPEREEIAEIVKPASDKALAIVSVETTPAENQDKELKKPRISTLLTNTRLKLKRSKDKPAILVEGDKSSVVISLSNEK